LAAITISENDGTVSYTIGGTPSSGPFVIDFPYFFVTELSVSKIVSGVSTPLVLTTDYTVAGTAADDGFSAGSLTLASALSNCQITIQRTLSTTKATNFSTNGPLSISVMNTLFSRLFSWAQDLRRLYGNTVRFPAGEEALASTLPAAALRANSVLGFDATGKPYAAALTGSLVGVATWLVNNFLAAGTSAANACTALGAAYLPGNNAFSGNNTHAGTETFNAGLVVGASSTLTLNTAAVPSYRLALKIDQRTAIADAAYAVLSTDYLIAYTSLTASRTVTLPAASTFWGGRRLVIVDESGSASSTVQISLAPNGTNTIAGSNTTQVIINIPRGRIELECNGSTGWFVVGPWSVSYTNSLSGDVALNNTTNYFTGPTVSQGTVGTWRAYGNVTLGDGTAAAMYAKLWDGTSVIASGSFSCAAGFNIVPALSGVISAPAGNIRISARDVTNATGTMAFNATGNSKDSTITVERIA
jgi:hypothetical protein